MFERFWRKDPARSGTAHTGFGLPLAKNFAELMGCTLNASLAPNGELVMTLRGDRVKSVVDPSKEVSLFLVTLPGLCPPV